MRHCFEGQRVRLVLLMLAYIHLVVGDRRQSGSRVVERRRRAKSWKMLERNVERSTMSSVVESWKLRGERDVDSEERRA